MYLSTLTSQQDDSHQNIACCFLVFSQHCRFLSHVLDNILCCFCSVYIVLRFLCLTTFLSWSFSPYCFSSFYFTSLFSFLHYVVTPGLHPSTVFCFYFFSFTFLFCSYHVSQHTSFPGFLSSALTHSLTALPVSALAYSFFVHSFKLLIPLFCPSVLSLRWRTQGVGVGGSRLQPPPSLQNRNLK
jgi:hypothetical protein